MNGGTHYWSFDVADDVADDKEIHTPTIHEVRAAMKTLESFVLSNELEESFMKVDSIEKAIEKKAGQRSVGRNQTTLF